MLIEVLRVSETSFECAFWFVLNANDFSIGFDRLLLNNNIVMAEVIGGNDITFKLFKSAITLPILCHKLRCLQEKK